MCLVVVVLTSSSLTQEMSGSNPFTVMTNEFSEVNENISGNSSESQGVSITDLCFRSF